MHVHGMLAALNLSSAAAFVLPCAVLVDARGQAELRLTFCFACFAGGNISGYDSP
jgi:hypothetical protein